MDREHAGLELNGQHLCEPLTKRDDLRFLTED
jgi:hypothetical protein